MEASVVLVPAFNEAARIGSTVGALRHLTSVTEIVVVDDGSTDETSHEARMAGACCLTLPRNVGKGDALNVGVGLVRQRIVDGLLGVPGVLLLADGDLGDSARHLHLLLRALETEKADVVVATLPPQEGAAGFGLARGMASAGLRYFTGRTMRQPLSGQRALRWTALPHVVPFAADFGVEVAMTLAASRANLDIVETEVPLSHNATGRDLHGILHRAAQAVDIGMALAHQVQLNRAEKRQQRITAP